MTGSNPVARRPRSMRTQRLTLAPVKAKPDRVGVAMQSVWAGAAGARRERAPLTGRTIRLAVFARLISSYLRSYESTADKLSWNG